MPKSKKKQKKNSNDSVVFWETRNNTLSQRAKSLVPLVEKQNLTMKQLNFQKLTMKKQKLNNKPANYRPTDISPFPPNIVDTQDFSKDLVDVNDSSLMVKNAKNLSKDTPSITPCKFVGKKIPVNMREDVIRKQPVEKNSMHSMHMQGNTKSNQVLKDCLTSDINTVVKDNIKVKSQLDMFNVGVPPPAHHNPQNVNFGCGPSGVPRSFLTRPNQTVIEPLLTGDQVPKLNPKFLFIQNHQVTKVAAMEQSSFDHIQQYQPRVANCPQGYAVGGHSATRYSPTDLYGDLTEKDIGQTGGGEGSVAETWRPGEKRVSAFDRLGPLAQPKTPKLTISLSFNKEQAVREVVDVSKTPPPQKKVHIPVHQREDIRLSTDDTVMKYVGIWPWAYNIITRRTAKSRGYQLSSGAGDFSAAVGYSPTAMMMLKEQMDEIYQRDNSFVAVSVTGYPDTWTKEDVLDAMLENLKGKCFIPCFIEFNEHECKFLVIRCRAALLAIHALDFHIQKDGVQLSIAIMQIVLSVLQLDFIPRLILRKRLAMVHSEGTKLDMSAFTLQPDVSHFIYYPLNHLSNQLELMKLQTDIIWCNLTELTLSHNRLTTVEGFDLDNRMPKLHHLDLSHNWIEKATMLICCRKLPLRSLKLEGNPLCHDYIDADHYITVVRMMFPTLRQLDDVPIYRSGEVPVFQRNYCHQSAAKIVDYFLQLFIPLMDSDIDDRTLLYNMYSEDVVVTITYRPKIGYDAEYRYPRSLLMMSRVLMEGTTEFADGRPNVEKLLRRWPIFEHDPSTFSVDVMFQSDTSLLFRLDGIVKLPASSLAENDQLVAFSRTILLHSKNGVEYKIKNEMIYWDEPTQECRKAAFRRTLVQRKPLSFKFESPPDEECKKRLITTFMKLTKLGKEPSERCLELKNWELREALNYFMKMYKVDNLQPLTIQVWKEK